MIYSSLFILSSTLIFSYANTQPTNETYIKQLAQEYHQLGIDNAAKDEYIISLSYFRSACRLQPNEAQYWNDLGICLLLFLHILLHSYYMAFYR